MWSKSISSLFFVSSAVLALASADQTFKVDMSSTGTATATALAPGSTSTSQGVIGGTVPVWVIKVGSPNNDEIFSPPQIKANPGDLVQFQFYSNNHSVASAMFDKPCVPELESDPSSKKAFWSGFMPTTDEGKLVFTMKVQDTQPIYFYCSQARHCQSGMVGAINAPTSGNTLSAFAQKAAQAPQNIPPTGSNGSNGTSTTQGSSGQSTKTQPATSATTSSALSHLNAASSVRTGAWSLGAVAVAAALLL